MVSRLTGDNYPNGEDRFDQLRDDPSMLRRLRLAQICHIHAEAKRADSLLDAFTKKFIIDFEPKPTSLFPFPHSRVRMRPQNRTHPTDIEVCGLRLPKNTEDTAFISWELTDGTEEYYILSPEQFSKMDIKTVFSQIKEGILLSPDALTEADELDEEKLLIVLNNFEPDLQNNRTDLKR